MNIQVATPIAKAAPMLLENKVCMITGAASSRGIGFATAKLFAQHGARLALVDIAMDDPILSALKAEINVSTGITSSMIGIRSDLQSRLQCDDAVARTLDAFGQLDSLVHSAGIVRGQPILSITESDYEQMLNVNLKGTFNICQSVLSVFEPQGHGSIVNLASLAAQRGGGLVGGAHYAASKGGVISFTRTIAREFGPRGIRANIVCPAMIETNMLDGSISPERMQDILAGTPLRRTGLPVEVAGACLFLASDLSAYVTGATLDVNGGSHIH